MAEMTGFIAIGHMLLEEGKIVAVRHKERGVRIDYDKIIEGQLFTTQKGDLEAEGWEIGWKCFRCMGDGVVSVPCPCVGRPRHIQAEHPCCDGWDEIECSECVGGIRWEEEY